MNKTIMLAYTWASGGVGKTLLSRGNYTARTIQFPCSPVPYLQWARELIAAKQFHQMQGRVNMAYRPLPRGLGAAFAFGARNYAERREQNLMHVITLTCDDGIFVIPVERIALVGYAFEQHKLMIDLILPVERCKAQVADASQAQRMLAEISCNLNKRPDYTNTYKTD